MSAIRKMTGMGGDVRQIAKLLQAKAPPGHKLAFINEEEAALLKSRGGSGRITPEGIPSYELEDSLQISGASPATEPAPITSEAVSSPVSTPSSGTPTELPPATTAGDVYLNAPVQQQGITPSIDASKTPQADFRKSEIAQENLAAQSAGVPNIFQGPATETPAPQPQAPEQSLFEKAKSAVTGLDPKTSAALGIGGVQSLLGANAVRKAQQDAAQAKQQLQAMAAPYQQQGQQLQQLSNQGQLTPANQQTLQAARAQLAQGAEARGGVGAAQAATQIANLTQNLLSQQMNLGIQLQGRGDKIAQGAIQTGIQADQYINQLTSSYAQNIARTVAGATGLPGQQTSTTITVPSGG